MRKIGGLIALVLAALLVIVGCDNSTANSNTDKWEDFLIASQPDTGWFDAAETEYTLNTANQILGIGKLVEDGVDFSGKTITLEQGVYDFSKISQANDGASSFIGFGSRKADEDGTINKVFNGDFDGNNSVIMGVDLSYLNGASNGTVTSDSEDNTGVGFFGVVQGTATDPASVKNLAFVNCRLVSTSNTTGIAVGYAENAVISGITVTNCEVIGPQGVGAVVGRVYKGGSISGCQVVNTTVKATAEGTVDYSEDQIKGESNGNYNAGGIVGCVKGSSADTDITVSGNTVDLTAGGEIYADYLTAGGICGTSSNATFSGNSVTVNSRDQIVVDDQVNTHQGAIVANASTNTTYDSSTVNKVEITGESTGEITVTALNDDISSITN